MHFHFSSMARSLSPSSLRSRLGRKRSDTVRSTASSTPSITSSAASSRSSSPAPLRTTRLAVPVSTPIHEVPSPEAPTPLKKAPEIRGRRRSVRRELSEFDPYASTGIECEDEWTEDDIEFWGIDREYVSVLEPRPERPVWKSFNQVIESRSQ